MKKFLPYIFILIALVGLFGLAGKAQAYDTTTSGICVLHDKSVTDLSQNATSPLTEDKCHNPDSGYTFVSWTSSGGFSSPTPGTCSDATKTTQTACETAGATWKPTTPTTSNFEEAATNQSCNLLTLSDGCFKKLFYYAFYIPSAVILTVAAKFFNALVVIALNSSLFSNSFIPTAWTVVRDLSNIFFILILLYIAIKVILDLGGHDAKKMIIKVIVIALLINFSMFFTEVIIDSSNILALIFYNKLEVTYKDPTDGQIKVRPYDGATGAGEKDISGGMYNGLDPTSKLNASFWDQTRGVGVTVDGKSVPVIPYVPLGTMIGVILIAVTVMLFASYAFFVSGLAFVGRLIELWVLIIFSPFAFMSYTVPQLASFEDLGWSAWFKRLISAAFMAPIFMFFMYLIFLLINKSLFGSLITTQKNWIQTILSIIIPAMMILILLMQATKFAKKGAGKIGEGVISGAKIVTGLAVGGAALGTAFAGRTVIARSTAAASRTEGAVHYGKARIAHNKALEEWERTGGRGPKPTWKESKEAYKARTGVEINEMHAFGGRINAAQSRSGEVDHARHEIDEAKKKAGLEGVEDKFLSGVEKEKIEKTFVKEKRSEIETDVKRGYDAKNEKVTVSGNGVTATGESDYKQQRRKAVIDETKREDPGSIDAATGELNDQGRKKVEDKLNSEFNEILKNATATIGKERFTKLQGQAQTKVGMATRVASRTTSGTYDIRNLSSLKTDKREGIGTKATVGIIAAITTGMRMGLKHGGGVDVGSPQGNFLKDLGYTINESLKHAKINVKLGDSGGGHKDTHGPTVQAHAPTESSHKSEGGGGHAPAGGGGAKH